MARGSTGARKLADLSEQGYSVTVTHLREEPEGFVARRKNEWEEAHGDRKVPMPAGWTDFGGETRVVIQDSEENVVAEGRATCNAGDHFNRRLGLAIAVGRAAKNLGSHQK